MLQRKNFILKIAGFLLSCIVLIGLLGEFIRPVWVKWNNYNTVHGFYEEKEDTIEVLFLGSSVVINGINAMQLYEEYGLASYNMGTEQQPVFASYYWLEEAYRLHSGSLKTVVLDTSMLRKQAKKSFYLKALDGLRSLEVRYKAFYDYTDNINDAISYTVPLFSWHSRWSELSAEDFKKFNYEPTTYTRGYQVSLGNVFGTVDKNEWFLPAYYEDEAAGVAELNSEALEYCTKIVDFCEAHDLELVLIESPRGEGWNDSLHNAVLELAAKWDIEFLDFNYKPLVDEIGYMSLVDLFDEDHLNYYGAQKLTSYIGKHLVENYDVTDVRGVEKYAYLEEQLSTYNRKVIPKVELSTFKDPVDYIASAMKNQEYSVFVTVKDEGSVALTEEQRAKFKELGLVGLAELDYRSSYIAVVDGGELLYECKEDAVVESGQSIEYRGVLENGVEYKLESGGKTLGNISSCKIDGEERSKNKRGINIVVFDKESGKVVDSVRFDTFKSSTRTMQTETAFIAEIETKDESEWSKDVLKYLEYFKKCQEQGPVLN